MEIPILKDIVIILGLSILIILAFQKLKLPAILGFLLAGIIVGPYALDVISSQHEVELLSEIGIIFLLFVIGIELSLEGLARIWKVIFIGGGIQVGGTILLTVFLAQMIGLPMNTSIFLGFLFSLSSTAIVLKLLQERGEIASPHGRISLGVLIFQDIIVVPMMLFTPLLAGETPNILTTVLIMVAKIVLILVIVYLLARFVAPKVFGWVVKTKNQELFILTVVVFCFAVAWLTSAVGLSLALGAFFAGLIISESDYSHQATANVLPFREIFISFFFVSVGTLLNLQFFFENFIYILLLTVGVVLLKMLIIGLMVLLLRYPARVSFLVLFGLFQVGEFSLLLSGVGQQSNILPENIYQYFLAISIITMGITPFLIAAAPKLTYNILKAPIPAAVRQRLDNFNKNKRSEEFTSEENLHDHLVVIGYGINGKNISKAARKAKIPYVVIDINPESFQRAKLNNEPVLFGDATNNVILKHAHIQEARVIVIAISDRDATKKIIKNIRLFTQTATIIVRTRYIHEIEEVIKLGADEVIPEEFETSIEIFTRVLKKYLVPFGEIQDFINQIRSSDYAMLTSLKKTPHNPALEHLNIPNKEMATIKVNQKNLSIVGKSIEESGLGKNYGVTLLGVQREGHFITEISPSTEIHMDDLLYIFGHPNNITNLNKELSI